jgi:hypothetical protein
MLERQFFSSLSRPVGEEERSLLAGATCFCKGLGPVLLFLYLSILAHELFGI